MDQAADSVQVGDKGRGQRGRVPAVQANAFQSSNMSREADASILASGHYICV